MIPITDGYTLHDRILHSRLVILKNCGHVPMEEKSDLFAELVTGFSRDRKGRVGDSHGDEALIAN